MNEITIKVKNKRDEALLLDLVKRLRMSVVTSGKSKKQSSKKALQWMEMIASKGGVAMANPIVWQQKNRKDRAL